MRAVGRFRSQVRLDGFVPGLNILAGPNERGKSTFFTALHHALFTPFACKDQVIRALVPWSTELSPGVTVEFVHADKRWLLKKTFLDGASCRLLEWTGSRYEPKFEADKADEEVRTQLLGTKPGKGAAKAEHRGLARLLWVPQGKEALDLPSPGDAVQSRVQKVMGRVTTDTAEDEVLARLRQLLADHYAPGGKEGPAGSELARLREQLSTAQSELETLQQGLTAVEGLCQQLAEAQARRARLEREKAETERNTETLAKHAERVAQIKSELRAAEAHLDAREQRFTLLHHDRDGLRTREQRQQELLERLRECQRALESAEAQCRMAEQDLDRRRQGEARARTAVDAYKQALEEAARKRLLQNEAAELVRLQAQLGKVEAADTALKACQARLEGVPEVADKERKRAAELERTIQDLETQVHAAGITVTLELDPERGVRFVSSEGEGSVSAGSHRPVPLFTLDRMELEIAQVGTLRIASRAGNARTLAEEMQISRHELSELLARYGVADRAALETLVSRRQALQDEVKTQRRLLAEALHGFDASARLRQAIAVLEGKVAQARQELGLCESAAAELAPPDDSALRAELSQAQETLKAARAALAAAEAKRSEAQQRQHQAQEALIRVKAEQQAISEGREEILRRYGRIAEMEQAYELARRERDAAEGRAKDLRAQLPEQAVDPEVQLQRHQEVLRKLERELRDAADSVAGLKWQVEQKGGEGLYSRVAYQEELVERLAAQLRHQQTRARAIRLLHELGEERQRRVAASLLKPLETEATALWSAITQLPSRQVVFSEDLSIKGVRVDGDEHPLEPLSVGAREQLFLVARLALARYLAQGERELFVIDDSLVNTDPDRLERFLAVLEQSASYLQIVLITCHPERYRGLRGMADLRIMEEETRTED